MIRVMRRGAGKKGPRATKTSEAELDALIEEAIVDAYDESEQIMGCSMSISMCHSRPRCSASR
jgi:hypothetical protein